MKKTHAVASGWIGAWRGSHQRRPAYWNRKNVQLPKKVGDVWARPGMHVTFRAELMPGRDRHERTFLVKELLSSGRVSLQGADGEHAEKEFEPNST